MKTTTSILALHGLTVGSAYAEGELNYIHRVTTTQMSGST